ncbi:hypothetical protein P9139_08160 [Curtobacterium flaccumfaciens]|nr:hypothetical protein P9139_08160 [Curtobacterium flaccumfaciens]
MTDVLATPDLLVRFRDRVDRDVTLSRQLVQMAQLDGADVVYVARHDGRVPFASSAAVGDRRPATSTALGYALLARTDDDDATSETDATDATARRAVEEARRTGWALDRSGEHPSVYGMAVAIDGTPYAIGAALVETFGTSVDVESSGRYRSVLTALRRIASEFASK